MKHKIFLQSIVFAALVLIGCTAPPTIAVQTALPTPAAALATRALETPRAITPTRPARLNGFETIALAQLPPQARETLALIERGGPFPYRQDGQTFENRERRLPQKPRGYYREYTVKTPGENDRGARRIVTGEQGEMYYTADHYNSFKVSKFKKAQVIKECTIPPTTTIPSR